MNTLFAFSILLENTYRIFLVVNFGCVELLYMSPFRFNVKFSLNGDRDFHRNLRSIRLHSGHRSDRDHFARGNESDVCSLFFKFHTGYFLTLTSKKYTGSILDTCFRKKKAHLSKKLLIYCPFHRVCLSNCN